MNLTYGVIGVLVLIAAIPLNSGATAICGVLLIIAADVVGYLEKILVELRTARDPRNEPSAVETTGDQNILNEPSRGIRQRRAESST